MADPRNRYGLGFQVDAGLLAEDMANTAAKAELNLSAHGQSSDFSAGHVHGGNDDNNVLVVSVDVQVDGGAHHFGHIHSAVDTGFQGDVLGADARTIS